MNILVVIFCISLIQSFILIINPNVVKSGYNCIYKDRNLILKSSLSSDIKTGPMAPADLTPAVDKFVRVPTIGYKNKEDGYYMTAKGQAPPGADPFKAVGDELQPLSDYVKELVVSENPVLTMAASHFFEKVYYFTYIYYF